jgi:FKBP-type peptidyl-prolyl cis-trans isomerase 2
MNKPIKGNKVKVHYTGKLDNGEIFDSSLKREPLSFTIGAGRMIKGFEQAVLRMNKGESKTVKIKADDAYGHHQEDLLFDVSKDKLPENIDLKIGHELHLIQKNGRKVPVLISEVHETFVKIDANHPLAGKDLIFELELLDVQ